MIAKNIILEAVQPLVTSFKKGGFNHTLVERDGNLAIFEKTKPGFKNYEVVKVKVHPGGEVFGKTIGPHERYPSSEQWGSYGWTESTLESARRRLKSLKEQEAVKGKGPTGDPEDDEDEEEGEEDEEGEEEE